MKLNDSGYSSKEIKSMVKTYMIDTYERFDFIAETAEGMYLYDENGQAYLDFYGGIAVNNTGNRNEKVVAAVRGQVGDLIHTFNYPYTIPQALLAKTICEAIGMDKIFYQSTGTEANEAMIKMARKYGTDNYGPNRYHIVTAKNSFHGRTYGSLSATGQPEGALHAGFLPLLPGFSYAEFNNLESFKAACTPDTIAIMIEPIQGEGGVNPATQEFIDGLKQLCEERDMLLLFDEVQTGWCRTGTVMSYMRYGVTPDIVSMAKAMGGGMPISAICAKAHVAKAFGFGTHGTTYGGNPVCCAAAYAQVTELLEGDYAKKAADAGAYFTERLKQLPNITDVRGAGLLIGVEFPDAIAVDIKHICLDKKLLITSLNANTIRMVPPLIVSESEINRAYEILLDAITVARANR